MVAAGAGEVEAGLGFHGFRLSVSQDETVLETEAGDGRTARECG